MNSSKHFLNIFSITTMLVFICITLYLIPIKHFDHDELEHSHVSWNIKEGKSLYKDFSYSHGPLLANLNSSIWKIFSLENKPSTLIIFRVISFLSMIVLLIITFNLASKIFGKNIGLYSIAFLLSTSIFPLISIEIRPDLLQNIFWLSGIYIMFTKSPQDKQKDYFLGLLWGLALLTNLKAFIPITISILCSQLFNKNHYSITNSLRIFSTSLLIFIPWLILLHYNNTLPEYFNTTLLDKLFSMQKQQATLGLQNALSDTLNFITNNIMFVFFLIIGYYKIFISYNNYPSKNIATISSILFLSLFLIGFYLQWWITFLPIFSIIAAYGFLITIKNLQIKKRKMCLVFILLLFLINLFANAYLILRVKTNHSQIRAMSHLLQITRANDSCLYFWDSLQGIYVFRPQLLYYWEFPVKGMEKLFSKKIGQDIFGDFLITKLQDTRCPIIIATDYEIKNLPSKTTNYIKENYSRVDAGLWLEKDLAKKY